MPCGCFVVALIVNRNGLLLQRWNISQYAKLSRFVFVKCIQTIYGDGVNPLTYLGSGYQGDPAAPFFIYTRACACMRVRVYKGGRVGT